MLLTAFLRDNTLNIKILCAHACPEPVLVNGHFYLKSPEPVLANDHFYLKSPEPVLANGHFYLKSPEPVVAKGPFSSPHLQRDRVADHEVLFLTLRPRLIRVRWPATATTRVLPTVSVMNTCNANNSQSSVMPQAASQTHSVWKGGG